MKKEKGFTLIELLVVVAVIAILSGIAFVTIQGVRTDAFNTKIKSELSQVRSNAESYFYRGGRGHYTGYDESDGWDRIADKVPACSRAIMGESEYQIRIDDGGDPDSYAQKYIAWAALCGTDPQLYYCIDYIGDAMEVTTDPGTESAIYECADLL